MEACDNSSTKVEGRTAVTTVQVGLWSGLSGI